MALTVAMQFLSKKIIIRLQLLCVSNIASLYVKA